MTFSSSIRRIAAPAVLAGLAAAAALPALAQTEVIIGAREPGSNDYVVGAAVAATLTDHSGLTGKVLTASGASVWMPMLDYREADLGVTSHYEAWLGWKGEGGFTTKHDVRAVLAGGGINVGLYVTEDSPVTSIHDIGGLRLASEFSGSPAVAAYASGELANAGLGWDDVQGIPRASLYASQREDFAEKRLDVFYASVNSAITGEHDSTTGIRFLSLDTSPEAMAKMREVYPALVSEVPAGPPGIDAPVTLTYLASYLVASGQLNEEIVYEVTKAMYEANEDFRAINPSLGRWSRDNFATAEAVIPYHDGAIRYYREAGIWTDEMQAHQDALLAE